MLIFKDAVFLHVPKTGGTWVKAAVANAGIDFEEHIVDGDIHGDLSYCPFRDRFVFAFVREPLSLYQAYWRFKIMAGWDARNPFDVVCAAPVFDEFVKAPVNVADYVERAGVRPPIRPQGYALDLDLIDLVRG